GLTFNPADLARADEPASQRPGQVNQTPTSNRVVESVTPERVDTNAVTGRLAPRSAYDQIIAEYTGPSVESMTQPGLPTPPEPTPTPDGAGRPAVPDIA